MNQQTVQPVAEPPKKRRIPPALKIILAVLVVIVVIAGGYAITVVVKQAGEVTGNQTSDGTSGGHISSSQTSSSNTSGDNESSAVDNSHSPSAADNQNVDGPKDDQNPFAAQPSITPTAGWEPDPAYNFPAWSKGDAVLTITICDFSTSNDTPKEFTEINRDGMKGQHPDEVVSDVSPKTVGNYEAWQFTYAGGGRKVWSIYVFDGLVMYDIQCDAPLSAYEDWVTEFQDMLDTFKVIPAAAPDAQLHQPNGQPTGNTSSPQQFGQSSAAPDTASTGSDHAFAWTSQQDAMEQLEQVLSAKFYGDYVLIPVGEDFINGEHCWFFDYGHASQDAFTAEEHYAIGDSGTVYVMNVLNGGQYEPLQTAGP